MYEKYSQININLNLILNWQDLIEMQFKFQLKII
jgi:hypothetical protein